MGFPAPAPSPMEGEAQVEEKPQGAESGGEGRGGDHEAMVPGWGVDGVSEERQGS